MAIVHFRNASVVYNSVDFSNHVRNIDITMSADELEGTAMGALSHTFVPGLRGDRIEFDVFQDYASGSIDATLSAQVGVAAGVTIVVKPDAGGVAATNPSYTMTACLFEYHPINGEVGTLQQTHVVLLPAATSAGVVRAVA